MRRAAVFLAVAFLAGCGLGLAGVLDSSLTLPACAAAAVIYGSGLIPSFSVRPVFKHLALLFLVLLVGGWRGAAAREAREEWPARDSAQVSEYEGVISSDPELEPGGDAGSRTHFVLTTPEGEKVRTVLRGRQADRLNYGDSVTVRGVSRRSGWGGSYLSGWLIESGRGESGQVNAAAAGLYAARRRAASMLEFGLEDFPEQAGILKALVLGYRKEVPRETRELFVATGSLHVFAISGLHIGIVCSFAVFILRCLRVPPPRWFPFLAVLLIGYTVMTGSSSSAVRACTMALVYFAGAFIGRKADSIRALAFSAFLICSFDPWYLFDPGFILSFIVAGGICVLGGAMAARMAGIGAPDPFLPAGGQRRSVLLRWLSGSAAVSASAWLVSAPLMLFFFGRLSPIGILSNLAVVPLAFATVLSGCCSMLLGNISMVFSDMFNHASLGLIFALERVIIIFSGIPFSDVRNVQIGLIPVLVWYALLAILTAVLRGFFAPRSEIPETV